MSPTALSDIVSEQFQAAVTRAITKLEINDVIFGAEVLLNTIAEEMVLALWGRLVDWTDCNECMPEPNAWVITWCPQNVEVSIHRWAISYGPGVDDWWVTQDGKNHYPRDGHFITHWRPIPGAPRG